MRGRLLALLLSGAVIALLGVTPHVRAIRTSAARLNTPAQVATACSGATVSPDDPEDAARGISSRRRQLLVDDSAIKFLDERRKQTSALSKAYEQSNRNMEARGFKRTGEIVVGLEFIRRSRPQPTPAEHWLKRMRNTILPSLVAQEIDGGEVEDVVVIWETWDDGDLTTWEGTQYYEDRTYGIWELTEQQSDVSTGEERVMWARLASSSDRRETRGDKERAALGSDSGVIAHAEYRPVQLGWPDEWGGTCGCADTFWNRWCIQQEIAGCHLDQCGLDLFQCATQVGPNGVWRWKRCMMERCGVLNTIMCVRAVNKTYLRRCGR